MSRPNERRAWHYGWVVVFAGALSLFACLGLARFAFGMLLPSMRTGLNLGFDQMGFISMGNFAGYLVSVALAPAIIRCFRPRATIVAALFLIALCMLGISLSHSFWQVLFLYMLVGMGSGFANIPVMVLVSHWFRRERRGRAAGLMVMGSGTGIVVSGYLVPALNSGLGVEGWRSSWQVLALLALFIAGTAGKLLRNDPADLGLEPVGRLQPLAPLQVAAKETAGAGRILLQLGLLYLVFGVTYMVYGTFIVTTMVLEHGFSEVRAGLFWSLVGWCSLVSGVAFGVLSDRIGRKKGLAAVFSVQTVAYLLAGAKLGTTALLFSVILYGLAAFAIPAIMAAAVGDYLGLSRAAQAFSLITLFFAAGQTIGPGAAGIVAEMSGTFTTSYLVAAALTGLAVLLTALLPRHEA